MEGLSEIISGAVAAATGEGAPEIQSVVDADTPEGDAAAVEGDGTEFVPEGEATVIEGEEEPPAAEGTTTTEPPVAEKKVETAPDADDIDNMDARDANGRVNRIPHPRVVKMVATGVAKAKTVWEKEHSAAIAERDARLTAYDQRFANIGKTEEIMFGNPAQMLGMLLRVPGYKEILGDVKLNEQGHVVAVGSGGQSRTLDAQDSEPQPDVIENGVAVGYSPKQHAALRAWDRRESARESAKLTREALDRDYKPIKDAFTSHESETKKQQAVTQQIEQAAAWPGFVENHQDILKAMNDDYVAVDTARKAGQQRAFQFKDIKAAYDHVMWTKAQGTRETEAQMEARLLKKLKDDLRAAPRSTSAGSAVPAAAAERGNQAPVANDTASIIRGAIKK